jgi:hypothetical protein
MFKFIRTFDDYDTPILPYNLNVTKEGIENLADGFLKDLGKDYDLRKDKPFDKKKGNCAWFTESFYEWCEINNIPARIIYFPETDKAKDAHVAILIGDFVLDFTHKQFSKDPKDNFAVNKVKHYEKFGYNTGEAEVVDEFPSWIDSIHPLDDKK